MTGHSIQPRFAGALGTSGKALGIAAGLAGSYFVADAIKPYVLKGIHDVQEKTPQDALAPELKTRIAAQRQQALEATVFNTYVQNGPGSINWYHMADIVDYVARNAPSDKDFKVDIWHLFGWRPGGERAPLVQYLDDNNTGLPPELHNSGYASEQMHHYLGGATGNSDKISSNLQNNRLYSYIYELPEIWKRGQYNWGDVRLFTTAQKHRDDFLKHGRMSVAPNIRAMLVPQTPTPANAIVQPSNLNAVQPTPMLVPQTSTPTAPTSFAQPGSFAFQPAYK